MDIHAVEVDVSSCLRTRSLPIPFAFQSFAAFLCCLAFQRAELVVVPSVSRRVDGSFSQVCSRSWPTMEVDCSWRRASVVPMGVEVVNSFWDFSQMSETPVPNFSSKKDFSSLIKEFNIANVVLPGVFSKPFDLSDMLFNMAKNESTFSRLNKVNKKTQYLAMMYDAIEKTISHNIQF